MSTKIEYDELSDKELAYKLSKVHTKYNMDNEVFNFDESQIVLESIRRLRNYTGCGAP